MVSGFWKRGWRVGSSEERDTGYIWLRQTAELALGDQRRTLEIAIPVRLGATPDEIARLLDEAEAGMERLGERMDRRVAAIQAAAPTLPAPALAATAPTSPAPAPALSAARPAAPAAPAPRPPSVVAERSATPARPTSASAPTTAPSTSRPAVQASPGPGPATAGGLMSRAEFLEQARGLDQSPRQVMDRLGVRTLEGLNYAEALEQIKRQLLREQTQAPQSDATAPAAPSRPAAPAPATAPATAPEPTVTPEPLAGRGPVSYFDEEDDYDVTFELPEDGAVDDLNLDALDAGPGVPALGEEETEEHVPEHVPEPAAPARRGTRREPAPEPEPKPAPDEPELDDVPDFAEPRSAAPSEPPARGRAAATPAAGSAAEPTPAGRPATTMSQQALAQRARARDLLARLREYRGGTPAGSDQIGPFTNVVIHQLGEPTLESLTDQVWGLTPAQLTAQQMRALIQWGKTDAFATEVVAVLELLAAEHAADASGETKTPASRNGRPAGRGAGSAR